MFIAMFQTMYEKIVLAGIRDSSNSSTSWKRVMNVAHLLHIVLSVTVMIAFASANACTEVKAAMLVFTLAFIIVYVLIGIGAIPWRWLCSIDLILVQVQTVAIHVIMGGFLSIGVTCIICNTPFVLIFIFTTGGGKKRLAKGYWPLLSKDFIIMLLLFILDSTIQRHIFCNATMALKTAVQFIFVSYAMGLFIICFYLKCPKEKEYARRQDMAQTLERANNVLSRLTKFDVRTEHITAGYNTVTDKHLKTLTESLKNMKPYLPATFFHSNEEDAGKYDDEESGEDVTTPVSRTSSVGSLVYDFRNATVMAVTTNGMWHDTKGMLRTTEQTTNRWQKLINNVEQACTANKGSIVGVWNDVILVTFPSGNNRSNACHAALQLSISHKRVVEEDRRTGIRSFGSFRKHSIISASNESHLEFSVGLATGKFFMGMIGNSNFRCFHGCGTVVDTAISLSKLGNVIDSTILCTEDLNSYTRFHFHTVAADLIAGQSQLASNGEIKAPSSALVFELCGAKDQKDVQEWMYELQSRDVKFEHYEKEYCEIIRRIGQGFVKTGKQDLIKFISTLPISTRQNATLTTPRRGLTRERSNSSVLSASSESSIKSPVASMLQHASRIANSIGDSAMDGMPMQRVQHASMWGKSYKNFDKEELSPSMSSHSLFSRPSSTNSGNHTTKQITLVTASNMDSFNAVEEYTE